ncbi:MAG: tetratricopeptide repeat-containing sensor histidine kinase [Microscillaceae bacterium]|jgi:signal transduction histidine kinase|nr:tetratricopeptide repeat-containing sensor histidine kinase [Microscillaceae bacterium]
MKIYHLYLFIFILLPFVTFAQFDSLQRFHSQIVHQPASFKRDTTLVNINNEIAWRYRLINADSTFKYAQQALQIAQKIQWKYGELIAYQRIGLAYRTKSDYPNTVAYFLKALKIAETLPDSLQMASCFNTLGLVAQWQYKYELSLNYFQKALKIYQQKKSDWGLLGIYNNIGLTFFRQKNYQDAFKNYRKALQLDQKIKDPLWHAITYRNLSEIYLANDSIDLAWQHAQEALLTAQKTNIKTVIISTLNIIASIHQKKEDYQQSIHLAQQSIAIARSLGTRDYIKDAYLLLYRAYKKIGKTDSTLINYEYYIAYRDSLLNEENESKIEGLKKKYEFDKQQAEQVIQTQKKQFENLYMRSLYAGFVFLGALAILLFINNLQKRKANKQLEQQKNQIALTNEELQTQNEKLNELNREKDGLMNVVAHDLRAPLNRIKGLVNVIELQNPPSDTQKYLDIIHNTCDSGRRLIQDLLDINQIEQPDSQSDWQIIELNRFIPMLVDNYQVQALNKSIEIYQLEPNNETIQLWTDETLLQRIMDNLLSNALKFSYKHSNIFVKWGQTTEHIFISIKDEGPGIKPEDRKKMFQKFQKLSAKPTAGEDSTGLGLAIVKSLTERLQGTVEVHSEEGRGAEFLLKFPIYDEQKS